MKNNRKQRILRVSAATVKMYNQGFEAIEQLIDKAASCKTKSNSISVKYIHTYIHVPFAMALQRKWHICKEIQRS